MKIEKHEIQFSQQSNQPKDTVPLNRQKNH